MMVKMLRELTIFEIVIFTESSTMDQKQFVHGSEEYKQYFEEECGRIDHVHLDKNP